MGYAASVNGPPRTKTAAPLIETRRRYAALQLAPR